MSLLRCNQVGPISEADRVRFLAKVDGRGPDECWPWTDYIGRHGYGNFHPDASAQRTVRAHRLAYAIEYGCVPAGVLVCHRCDVRSCCNPAHLFLGTQRDNVVDMWAKGRGSVNVRGRKGEANPRAKLTDADVLAIRALPPRKHLGLAKRYGVSRTMINLIQRGAAWQHVKGAISLS